MKRVPASSISFGVDGFYYCGGEQFTGVAYTEFPDGKPRSESEYRDGLRWGKSTAWHKNGAPAAESEFFRDVMHGTAREWSPTGQLESEIVCEYGITLHEREWDAQGNLLKEYRLEENKPDHRALLNLRNIHGTAGTA